jgi:hypothetical protein
MRVENPAQAASLSHCKFCSLFTILLRVFVCCVIRLFWPRIRRVYDLLYFIDFAASAPLLFPLWFMQGPQGSRVKTVKNEEP